MTPYAFVKSINVTKPEPSDIDILLSKNLCILKSFAEDKIDSIPGINTSPSLKRFEDWVNKIGAGIISQSKEICPADNKIYSLRNETGTVPSLPLICCSILSKKIAEGIQGIVLDIKVIILNIYIIP